MIKIKKTPFSCKKELLTIRGNIYQLDNETSTKPVVILSHGFLYNQRMCVSYAKELAKIGYLTITFDFCGGGLGCKSDGKTEDMTILTEKEDLITVIDYVQQNYPSTPISLLGCSQGGFVSALVAASYPDIISKLILFYPALCIPDDARKGKMMFYHFDPDNIPNLLGKHPMKLGGNYARCVIHMDPFEQMKPYQGQVLLLHGDRDSIVNLSYAKTAAEIYSDCEFHIIPKGTHMFFGKCNKIAIKYLLDFMKQQ